MISVPHQTSDPQCRRGFENPQKRIPDYPPMRVLPGSAVRRPRAAPESLQPGQATDPSPGIQPATSHVAGSTRENPDHRTEWPRTPREKRPPPGSKMAASALPLLPQEPPPGPQKRDKDAVAPAPRSGKLCEARGPSRAPGR